MTNRKTTRRALVLSILSLLVCCSMLVGTTFAWFTDSVTSGNNKIVAGNLDIELVYSKDMKDGSWASVADAENLFSDSLWEPGHTQVVYLKLSNEGSLALKYQFQMTFEETAGTNMAGETFLLSEHLKYDIVDVTEAYADRNAARKAVEGTAETLAAYSVSGEMLAGAEDKTMALVVYMPEEVANEANYLTGTAAPTIFLKLNLFATQKVEELDSFGSDYDAGTAWTGAVDIDWYLDDPDAATFTIDTAEELAGFAALVNGTATAPVTTYAADTATTVHDDFVGKTVKLGANIDLRDVAWTPIGRIGTKSTDFTYAFRGTFDGCNYTVSHLNVSNEGWAGLFGIAYKADIRNVKLSDVTIKSNRMAGSVVGQIYGSIDNCHVTKATIMVVPNAVGDTYDNGDKVGGIVGWIGDNDNNRTLTNCSVEGSWIGAYRDVGGIAGYAATTTTITGNSVTATNITVDQTTNYYGEKDTNAGAIYGRGSNVTADNNTVADDVTITSTYSKGGLTLKEDGITEEVTLYLVPASYKETTVEVPEGVTSIGGYAFAYNSDIEKIVLPSTVTTLNDRAFRDTSASTVVLNEGLKNISYQAFRNATNVESVEIPSTVTTIGKEAFQNSGVKTLTIPANVTTIEYGGLRDMKMLESVTIEGNVDIPVYAFRACTNLKTVIINGEDVTFGGGSRGMIFTNKENGDGSAITVYVKNETVKERLLAADTAAKDYGGYKIVVGVTPAADEASLMNALSNGAKEIALISNVSAKNGIVIPEGVTLDGNGNTIVYNGTEYDYQLVKLTTGASIKNVTLENYRVRTEDTANGIVTMENVTINMDNQLTGLDISRGAGTAKLTKVICKGITDATHLDPATQVQVDYTPYGDVLLGTTWGLEATNCEFGSLHGWNTTNGSNVSLNNTTYTVFRMHYWNNRTLYINGVETAWSESGAIPVAHDVGGCWSVQPAFK